MDRLHKGDRVKLTEQFAKCIQRNKTTDWLTRKGTITCTPRPGGTNVMVHWDGTKSSTSEPRRVLELTRS